MGTKFMKLLGPLFVLAVAAFPSIGQEMIGIFDQQADWGPRSSVKEPGSASFSNGTYHLEGNGDDIWNNDDEGFFLFTERSGSWTLEGEFTWIDPGSNDWAKLGPMIREKGANKHSRHYWMMVRGAGEIVQSQWRMTEGGASGWPGDGAVDENGDAVTLDNNNTIWMRVSRVAEFDVVFVEWSRDGQEWFVSDSQVMNFPDTVAYGLAITNHEDNDFLATGEVSNVDLREFDRTVAGRSFGNDIAVVGEPLNVTLQVLNPAEGTLTEQLPENWTASDVSNGGTVDGNTITWTLDSSISEVSYTAMPEDGAIASTFSGDLDGFDVLGSAAVTLLQGAVGELSNHADIGVVETTGDATFNGTEFNVKGGGADIWGSADAMHFAFSEFEGPFRIAGNAILFPFESSNEWVKGGLMIRNNLTPGSSNAFTQMDGQGDNDQLIRWQQRLEQGANSSAGDFFVDQFGDMIIERRGKTVLTKTVNINTGEEVVLGTHLLSDLEDPVYGGIAVTSHEVGSLSEIVLVPGIESLGFDFIELFNLSADRRLERTNPIQGSTFNVTIGAFSRNTTEFTLIERPPEGWEVSNITTEAGSATLNDDGSITWNATGAEGEVTLSYDLTVPEDATEGSFSGEMTADGESTEVVGPALDLPFLVDTEQYPPLQFENGVAFSEAEALPVINNDPDMGPPFEVVQDPNASGGAFVNNLWNNTDNVLPGFMLFVFEVPTDDEYAFIARTITPSGDDDSWWIAVNAEPLPDTGGYRWQGSGNDNTEFENAWVAVDNAGTGSRQTWDLAAGANFMVIHPREDGSIVDWIAVTNREDLDPATFDPANIPPPTKISNFMLY